MKTNDYYKKKILSRTLIDSNGCWLWQGAINRRGYGNIRFDYRTWSVHRLAYHLFVSPVPSHVMVCHRCDVRNCVNPEHLFLGTAKDNHVDRASKERGIRKLSHDQVRAIRADPRRQDAIAATYGVTKSAIAKIKQRVTYSYLTD